MLVWMGYALSIHIFWLRFTIEVQEHKNFRGGGRIADSDRLP
jgi:hypothetical protein